MHAILHQIRSIEKAEFHVDKLAVIAGPHRSGKTSIFHVLGSTMLGRADAYGATSKSDDAVRRSGARVASCRVEGGDLEDGGYEWGVDVRWPDMEPNTWGPVPEGNEVTIGRVSPAEMTKPEWAKFVRSISNTGAIDKQQIQASLKKTGLAEGEVQSVMSKLAESGGWDEGAKIAEKNARQHRANWEAMTGENFGTKKAEGWTHKKFLELDDDEVASDITKLDERISRASITNEAMGGSLKDLTKEINAYSRQIETLEDEAQLLKVDVSNIKSAIQEYAVGIFVQCPCCEEQLEYEGGKLLIVDETKKSTNCKEYDDLVKLAGDKAEELHKAMATLGELRAKRTAAQSMQKKARGETIDPSRLEAFKTELFNKRELLEAYQTTMGAEDLFHKWDKWSKVAKYLGPAGARLDATKKALKELQPRIDGLSSKLFGGSFVILEPDEKGVSITFEAFDKDDKETWSYDSIVWKGDPNSAALRLQVLFQILEAQRLADGEVAPILIDRFDLLLKKERQAMLQLLLEEKVPAVLFQAGQAKPEKDLLAKAKVGKSYWIDDGVLEAV